MVAEGLGFAAEGASNKLSLILVMSMDIFYYLFQVENFPTFDDYLNHIQQAYDALPPAIKDEISRFSEQVNTLENNVFKEYINRVKRYLANYQ